MVLADSGGSNVSDVRPDRRSRFGLCRKACESSDVLRCRRLGLRKDWVGGTLTACEGIFKILATSRPTHASEIVMRSVGMLTWMNDSLLMPKSHSTLTIKLSTGRVSEVE